MITTHHTSNIDAVLAQAQAAMADAPKGGDHTLEVRNTAEYAAYLHAKEGYSVLNDDVLRSAAREAVAEKLAARNQAGEMLSDADVAEALDAAADATVDYYQSAVGTTDKPGTVKLPPRPQHPGGWADDTEKLASSYESRIDGGAYKRYDYD